MKWTCERVEGKQFGLWRNEAQGKVNEIGDALEAQRIARCRAEAPRSVSV